MKTLLSGVAIGATLAAGAYAIAQRTTPRGLQRQITGTTSNSYSPNKSDTKTYPMIIELSGDRWRFLSINGVPTSSMNFKEEKAGKPWPFQSMRVTAELYLLNEKHDEKSDRFDYHYGQTFVSRLDGSFRSSFSIREAQGEKPWSEWTTSEGHCEATTIAANL